MQIVFDVFDCGPPKKIQSRFVTPDKVDKLDEADFLPSLFVKSFEKKRHSSFSDSGFGEEKNSVIARFKKRKVLSACWKGCTIAQASRFSIRGWDSY